MRLKKAISLLLTGALVINGNFIITGNLAKAQESTEKYVVYVAAEGEDTEGHKVALSKTPVQVEAGTTAKEAIKQVLDASAYQGNYTITENEWGGSLDEIGDVAQTSDWSYYWGFNVNGVPSDYGIGTYQVEDQDQISLLYGSYGTMPEECTSYADDTSLNPDITAASGLVSLAKEQREVLAEAIYQKQFDGGKNVPGIENPNGLYSVYSLARAEYDCDEFYDAVYAKVKNQLATLQQRGRVYDAVNQKFITEKSILEAGAASQYYAKIILFVTAIGKNAEDIGGFDLIAHMTERNTYLNSSIYSRESTMLLALDSVSYEIPQDTEQYVTRAELVNEILNNLDGNIAIGISWGMDTPSMEIQPLVPYRNAATGEGIDGQLVTGKINQVMGLIQTVQAGNGYIGDAFSPNNVWSLAQVMVAAGALGIDVTSEADGSDLIKNGKTLYDNVAEFIDVEKKTVDDSLMSFQPEQLLRGLDACIRAGEGRNSIFDAADVSYIAKESETVLVEEPNTPDNTPAPTPTPDQGNKTPVAVKTALTKSMIQKIPAQVYTGRKLKPAVTVKNGTKKLVKGKDYTVSYQKNKKLGKASVTVKGIGNYTGSQKVAFKIVLKKGKVKKIVKSGKKATVMIKKVTGAKGYQIQISTDKKFKKNVMTRKIKSNKPVIRKKQLQKKLKRRSGRKYFVRVRAYSGKSKGAYGTGISLRF